MKKNILTITLCICCLLLTATHAAEKKKKSNKRNNNIKIGMAIPRMTTLEYERKLPGGFSAYGNYSTAEVDIESIKSEINGTAAGIRYEIPLFKYLRKIPFLGPVGKIFIIDYVGIGYGNIDIDYNYIQTIAKGAISQDAPVNVQATFGGAMVEIGKDYQIGPVLLGLNISYIPGSPDIAATVTNTPVPSGDVNAGAATIEGLPNITLQLGYAF